MTQLGSDLPARLKRDGTGELPGELAAFRGAGMSAKANDALAVIRITVQEESEAAYAQALGYLDRLLSTTDFPRSYAIEFRGPTKTYLPIKGLPKKGVHQLFACAAAYPALHPAIEAYARRAMREYEWYTNLDAEDCAMPGSFAVFALGCASAAHAPLVLDYLALADGEHQSMHGRYVEGYLDAHGFTGRRSRTCWPAPAISSICGTARPTRSGSPTRTAWAGCWRRAGASRATPLPRSRRCARISWASASTRRHSGPRAMRSGASRRTRIAAAR